MGVQGRNKGVRKQYTPYLLEKKSRAGKQQQCNKALVSGHQRLKNTTHMADEGQWR